MRRLRALPPRRFDALLALVVLVLAEVETFFITAGDPGRALAMALLVPMAGSLALRRRAPLRALTAFFAAGIPMTLAVDASEDLGDPFVMSLIWGYTLGSHPDVRTALRGLALLTAGLWGVAASFATSEVTDFFFPVGFAAAAWGAGRAIRHRTRLAAELHEAAVRAQEEREAQAARAVADERRRIAREMHDVVAHSVAVMVVQAGGARRILERDPERAVDAARLIERTGRNALVEMRRLLGVLGSADEAVAMAPQPTLDEIDALVGRARDAGLPATLHIEGDRRPLPAGAEAAVYRVVQEALTNALKHSGSAPTDVLLHWAPEALEVVVADRGTASVPSAPLPGGGHGIVGMRERMKVYGGSLTARPRPDGGFVVRARIPLSGAELQVA